MEKLNEDWITQNHIDFEYKKYLLLAYLQHVESCFCEVKLYPALSELVSHYRNLLVLREQQESLFKSFPEKIAQVDLQNFKLVYEKLNQDDKLMQELKSIIDFSIPQFQKYLAEGKRIYDFIETQLKIEPVGIVPMYHDEGYLLLQNGKAAATRVYEYQITLFDQSTEKYRAIGLHYITSFERTISNTYENIKQELLRYNLQMPCPATYLIASDMVLSIDDTLLPLAKRSLVKHIARMSA